MSLINLSCYQSSIRASLELVSGFLADLETYYENPIYWAAKGFRFSEGYCAMIRGNAGVTGLILQIRVGKQDLRLIIGQMQ